ncbi:MAG: type II toxin-antitoxin system RelE/ParE family toxin [Mariniphaga sp.]|nr:type II toxin-antitoxin system RelE/ParE family toxin [Mariniphaga sp.]
MARRIIWVLQAQKDRKEILAYWKDRNKSDHYSKKLDKLFRDALKLTAKYPWIGKPTNKQNIRIKIVRSYFLIYEIGTEEIIVLRIWDSRQNPKKIDSTIE